MKPKSKKEILAKLMKKGTIIQEHILKLDQNVRQLITQSPIHVTQMMVSRQTETITDTSTIYQIVPGFKVNNQSTYKQYGSIQRKQKEKFLSITKFQTYQSLSLNQTISKINLSPRPKKSLKCQYYMGTSYTFRKNTPHRVLIQQTNNQNYYNQPSYCKFDRWDTNDDRNENNTYIF